MNIDELLQSPELEEKVLEIIKSRNVKAYKPDDILSASEACAYLGIKSKNPSAVLRHRANPKHHDFPLKSIKGLGKEYKYQVKDLDTYKKHQLNRK